MPNSTHSGGTIELGCGLNPHPDSTLRHDCTRHSDHVDIAFDLDLVPWPLECSKYDRIFAFDVFEHLRTPIPVWLAECWRILVPNGLLAMRVPHVQSWHAFADPTHIRGFHQITFDYFDPDTIWWNHYGKFYETASTGKWWKIVEKTFSRGQTDFGLLTDIQFLLQKRAPQ